MKESIFIVEDDLTIRTLLQMALKGAGYENISALDRGDVAFSHIRRDPPDLVLLDVALPGLDGVEVARRIRADAALSATRIIMVTARTQPSDVVLGLEAGADDYITKPYDREVLLARVKAVLRRGLPVTDGIDFDGLRIDEVARRSTLAGKELALTPGEFDLLVRLVAHRGRIMPRSADQRSLDVQVAKLRQKLGAWAGHIETVRGVGYRVAP